VWTNPDFIDIDVVTGEAALQGWIEYMQAALIGEDRWLARRIIHQFVVKIVIKQKTGTLYYTFPFPDYL
jgi:hypothetical protein